MTSTLHGLRRRARTWGRSVGATLVRTHPRNRWDTAAVFRRRGVVSSAVLATGATGLALSLRMPRDSRLFPVAALGVAGVWAAGGVAAGPLHMGEVPQGRRRVRPVTQGLAVGAGLGVVFIGGAFVVARIPLLADQVGSVLAFAEHGSLPVLTATTFLSGIAEEIFFRGALYAAIPDPHQVPATTAAYVVATVLTGNPMLAFGALGLGVVTGFERRATGGVLAPALTHVTWSMMMMHLLPQIVGHTRKNR